MQDLPDVVEMLRAIRLRNLRIVMDRAGGLTELANHMRVTPARIQALTQAGATVHIGDTFARRVEQVFQYPKNWLDHPNGECSILADVYEKVELLSAEKKTAQAKKLARELRNIQRVRRERKREVKE